MTTKLDTTFDNAKQDAVKTAPDSKEQPKRDIYPEMNSRFKTLLLWLGLGFIAAVVLIQQFSGYN